MIFFLFGRKFMAKALPKFKFRDYFCKILESRQPLEQEKSKAAKRVRLMKNKIKI